MRFNRLTTALAALLMASSAFAQTVTLPSALPLGQGDYVQIIKNGAPSALNVYALSSNLGGTDAYSYQTPLTGATIAPANTTSFLIIQPAGAIAALTVTLPLTPSDGQRLCIMSTQVVTTLTVSANTGQTIVGAATATTVNNVAQCWIYRAPSLTWYRFQ